MFKVIRSLSTRLDIDVEVSRGSVFDLSELVCKLFSESLEIFDFFTNLSPICNGLHFSITFSTPVKLGNAQNSHAQDFVGVPGVHNQGISRIPFLQQVVFDVLENGISFPFAGVKVDFCTSGEKLWKVLA